MALLLAFCHKNSYLVTTRFVSLARLNNMGSVVFET